MRSPVTGVAILVLAAGLASCRGPRVVIAGGAMDLGQVAIGDALVHEFVVRNDGAGPLTLTNVRVEGPGRVTVCDSPIAPGQTGRIRIEINTFLPDGPAASTVRAETNDRERPELSLALKFSVHASVIAEPPSARFDMVQREPVAAATHLIRTTDGTDVRVTGIESPRRDVLVSLREAGSTERAGGTTGRQWLVGITVSSRAELGPFEGFVTVHVDHPRQSRVRIPVSIVVRPLIAVTPPAAVLGDVMAGTEVARLDVRVFSTDPIDVTDVGVTVRGFAARLETVNKGRAYTIIVSAGRDASPGPFTGAIVIHAASDRIRTVSVPLSGRLARPAP